MGISHAHGDNVGGGGLDDGDILNGIYSHNVSDGENGAVCSRDNDADCVGFIDDVVVGDQRAIFCQKGAASDGGMRAYRAFLVFARPDG